MDIVEWTTLEDQRIEGPTTEITIILKGQRMSSVGIMGRLGITKTSARVQKRIERKRKKNMFLLS